MHPKSDKLGRKLRSVRLRCDVNVLLEQIAWALAAAGLIGMLGVLFERVTAVRFVGPWALWIVAGAVVASAFLLWRLRRPTTMQAALLIDRRLALHERFSTALALAGSDEPFSKAAVAEACQKAESLSLKEHFPLRPSRRWLYAAVAWAAVAGAYFLLPGMDLFGREAKRLADKQEIRRLEQAKADVREVTTAVKAAVSQIDDAELKDQLAALDEVTRAAGAEQIRRRAIRKLGDLSEQLKQKLKSDNDLQAAETMRSMLRRLRSFRGGLSERLNKALAEGDFTQASRLVRQFQKDLAEGKLTKDQQEALAGQMEDLAKQIEKLAAENKEFKDELAKAGCDRGLARLSEQDLREALRKQGLSDEQIEELLKKASACRSSCEGLGELAEAMASCAGESGQLSAEELAELLRRLDSMGALEGDLAAVEASLAEIGRAIACLGEGQEGDQGGAGLWEEGLALRRGQGTGGPGRGAGPRGTAEEGETATQETRVKNKPRKGPIIASWYFKGPQAKGEAARELTGVVEAARDRASEAVNENRIPRRYESAVKKYFSQLQEQGGEK